MKLLRALAPCLVIPFFGCAHDVPEAPLVRSHLDTVVTATDPTPVASAPTVFANGELRVDVPDLESMDDVATETRGGVRGDHDGVFYSVIFRLAETIVDRATVRRAAGSLRLLQGADLEEITLADGRHALRAHTMSADTGDHRVTIVVGAGRYLLVVTTARLESYADDEALRAASSARETTPSPVGGCMLAVEPSCYECVESDGRVCTFEESRCTGDRTWFAEGCPDTYDNALVHQTSTRTTACVVADGAEVVHHYAWRREGEPWPPAATRVSDCERLHGRLVPGEPRARVTP